MMYPKERLLKILNNEVPDKLPWFADLNYWHFSQIMKRVNCNNDHSIDNLLKIHRELNVGYYLGGCKPVISEYYGSNIYEKLDGYDDLSFILKKRIKLTSSDYRKGNDIDISIDTPFGRINSKWKYSSSTYSWAPIKYFIESPGDMRVFKYWVEHSTYKPDYRSAFARKKSIDDLGFLLAFLPRSPLMQMITIFSGIENTVNLWLDKKNEFDELMELMERKSDEAAEIIIESPAELLMIPENLSSDVVGKKFFHEYLEPYEKKWNKRIKKKGKFSLIHMDGLLKGLIKEVSQTEPSAIEAITPKPVGDIEINEIEVCIENGTVLWGGIPGVFFTDAVNEKNFKEFVINIIRYMTTKPKFVLGIGDQFPPDGIINRVLKVSELIEEHGYYQ